MNAYVPDLTMLKKYSFGETDSGVYERKRKGFTCVLYFSDGLISIAEEFIKPDTIRWPIIKFQTFNNRELEFIIDRVCFSQEVLISGNSTPNIIL